MTLEGILIDPGSPGIEPSGGFASAADGSSVQPDDQLLLQAGVVGVPNAGKSTLTNALVKYKVSAVSPKTNTTASTRLGAFTSGHTQVVLYDTPGVVDAKNMRNQSHEQRVRSAWTVATNCDLLLFIIDAQRQLWKPDPRVTKLIHDFGSGSAPAGYRGEWDPPPAALILNKVDAIRRDNRPALLRLAEEFRGLAQFEDIFWVSALKGQGLQELQEYLVSKATPGQWTLDGGPLPYTDMAPDEIAAELVREKIFQRFYEEIPYELGINTRSFKTLADGSVRIELDVVVPSSSVRKIVVGKGGAAIGSIGKAARLELEEMWNNRVHLILNVIKERP